MFAMKYNEIAEVKSMRTVTPKSLLKLDQVLSSGYQETTKTVSVPILKKRLENDICNLSRQAKTTVKSRLYSNKRSVRFTENLASPSTPTPQKKIINSSNYLKYLDYKEYHGSSCKNKNRIFKETFLSKSSIAALEINRKKEYRKESDPHERTNDNSQDNFMKFTIFSRPALSYGDKLYRLNLVSVIK